VQWIYLSPHPDDVALSCGGLVWEQANDGDEAGIWTICAGDPPNGPLSAFADSLHARWGTGREASAARREEDLHSCAVLGAHVRHFSIPDCIYRRSARTGIALYDSEQAIFGPIHPEETVLVRRLARQISQAFGGGANVVCPLALGGHVDHRMVRAAAEKAGCYLWYYADYPSVLKETIPPGFLQKPGCVTALFSISNPALAAWEASIAAHASQTSTFWPDLDSMRAAIAEYCLSQGGVRLWRI
jgi:LmbE family N-acetylglucosaminyl deacetylase